jgi:hypothetical protein
MGQHIATLGERRAIAVENLQMGCRRLATHNALRTTGTGGKVV